MIVEALVGDNQSLFHQRSFNDAAALNTTMPELGIETPALWVAICTDE